MIWAAWILLAVYLLSAVAGIAMLNKPVTKARIVTPGAAAFTFVVSLGLIGCLNLIGWNWATLLVAADVVWTIVLGIYRIGKVPKMYKLNAWWVFHFIENLAVCVLIVIGASIR